MYKKRTILEVQDWGDKWQIVYIIEHVPEPGDVDQQIWAEQGGHCFPKDIFEWRAAEYDIDPTDMDTLVDIVLAEPFLEDSDYVEGEGLFDAPTLEGARLAHKARCARGKLRGRITTRGKIAQKDGLLHKIRNQSPMHEEVIAVKREHTKRQSRGVKAEKTAMNKTGEERAKELRKQLLREARNDG